MDEKFLKFVEGNIREVFDAVQDAKCPSNFDLLDNEECKGDGDCERCWFNALGIEE